jgi:Gpi18-like mannosyltransferase
MNALIFLKNKINLFGLTMLFLFSGIFFVEFYLRKIFNDNGIPPLNIKIVSFLTIVFSGLLFLYLKLKKYLKTNDISKKVFTSAIYLFIAFQVFLVLIPPTGSADVYNYIFTTKVLTHYQANPYLVPEGFFNNDPLINLTFTRAHNVGLIYGPLWLLIYITPSLLSSLVNNIWLSVVFFKLVAIIFNIGSAYLIYKILEIIQKKYKYIGTILYMFNPFLLYEIANNGHNDILMVFFILLSFFFWLKNKYYLGLIFLILSSLIKIVAIILLPIFVLIAINKKKLLKNKATFIINSVLIFLLIYYLAFLFSGGNPTIIAGILDQGKVFNFLSLSPLPLVLKLLKMNPGTIKLISSLVFFILYFIILLKIILGKEKNKIIENYLNVFIIYFLTGSTMFMPWYFIWAIPLSILINQQKINIALTTLGFASYTILTLFIVHFYL